MNNRRLANLTQARAEWERQLRLITTLGCGKPGVTKWLCEYSIKAIDEEIEKEQ